MRRMVAMVVFIIVVGAWPVHTKLQPVTVLSVIDAAKDDSGHGNIRYPQDDTFHPGLLDITRFEVAVDDTYVYFRFGFPRITNPWQAPEGFYHQRIDVFIHTGNEPSSTQLLRPGPGIVRFHPQYPWHVWLRIAPWDGVSLFYADDTTTSDGRHEGTAVKLVDEETIQVAVPQSLVGVPHDHWRYYVIVGSFDALGIDGYRLTTSEASQWLLKSDVPDLRIVDLVARAWGRHSQRRQLRPDADGIITLYPIRQRARWPYWAAGATIVAVGLVAIAYRKRRVT